MGLPVRHPKDFYAGLMYAVIGAGAILIARDYSFGTSVRMGPGYFPTVIGALLVLVGGIAMARSFLHSGDPVKPFAWKEIVLVIGSVALFGVLVRGLGLALALILLVVIAAWASERFRLRTALILAIATSVASSLVFVKGLGLPFPLVGPWLGG